MKARVGLSRQSLPCHVMFRLPSLWVDGSQPVAIATLLQMHHSLGKGTTLYFFFIYQPSPPGFIEQGQGSTTFGRNIHHLFCAESTFPRMWSFSRARYWIEFHQLVVELWAWDTSCMKEIVSNQESLSRHGWDMSGAASAWPHEESSDVLQRKKRLKL